MNKKLLDIIDEVKGLEDAFKWIKAVMHLDKRIVDLEEAMSKVAENQEKIINILESKEE